MDPGGFWTQDEYRSVVAYAAAHFMTVVPDHLGGDEVPSTLLSQDRYAALVNREGGVVNGHGKTVMGWAEIAGSGTALREGSVAEYWNPASGSTSGTITATEAVQKKMKIVMAPANHTYLDQKYASHVPPDLGLTWACGSAGCDVDKFYNWDPGSYVDGVTDAKLIGVEGAMWGETVVTLSDVDYMVFPRLLALAELGWSPLVARTPSGPAYQDFLDRLAAQGARFMTRGTNFYPSPKVPWRLALVAAHPTVSNGRVSGALAMLSAPGVAAGAVTASIDWGDGTTTPGNCHRNGRDARHGERFVRHRRRSPVHDVRHPPRDRHRDGTWRGSGGGTDHAAGLTAADQPRSRLGVALELRSSTSAPRAMRSSSRNSASAGSNAKPTASDM